MRLFQAAALLITVVTISIHAQEREQFLIPIATDGLRGANGGEWGSRVRIFNHGDVPVTLNKDVPFGFCDVGPTPTELPPLQGVTVCSLGSEYPPARIFEVNSGKKIALESTLITPSLRTVTVPVVPLRQFRDELVFDRVPVRDRKRLALRLYHNEFGTVFVRVRVIRRGEAVADQQVLIQSASPGKPGYVFIPLNANIVPVEPPVDLTILVESDVPLWGVVSSTHNQTSEVELHTPAATSTPAD